MQWSNVLWGIAYAAPSFIVFLLAAILGLLNLNKHKPAALYAMLGGVIGALIRLSSVAVHEVVWANMSSGGSDIESMIAVSRFISIGSAVVDAVALSMIVSAVFVGRKPVRREEDEPTEPASRPRS